MSSIKVLKSLNAGKGITMHITIDENEPEDSVHRYAMDTVSTGEEILSIPAHWHKDHAEHLSVVEGRMNFVVDGKKVVLKAGDQALFVARRVVHSFESFPGERLILRERPDPAGMYKALFFNDIFSTGKFGNLWHVLRAFYDGDTYISLPFGSQALDQVFLTVVGGIAHLFAPRKPTGL
ncbi:hypothetical protein GGR57DRAFT_185854 [Xylariaceae sp. FL1272]|nr:hypothetical protein GGR57DRAFT_185854 [Xylariaceae sp. FL1272]